MRTRGARSILAFVLAAALLGGASTPAWAASGSAADEYTLDLPGDNGSSFTAGTASPGGAEAGDGRPQSGVAGESEEAVSPLRAAIDSPIALVALAALLAALTFGLLMGTVRPGSPKQ